MRSYYMATMQQKKLPMLKIDYRLTGSGWSECTILADGRECAISAGGPPLVRPC
jgi:hypothetical protein